MSDCRARALGAGHAMLSYHAKFLRKGRTEEEEMYVTSVWQRLGGGWVNLFSQDTPTY